MSSRTKWIMYIVCLCVLGLLATYFLTAPSYANNVDPKKSSDHVYSIVVRSNSENDKKTTPDLPEPKIYIPDLTTEEGVVYRVYELCSTEFPNVNPKIVLAIISVESNFVPTVVNASGTCFGLMQLNKKYFIDEMEEIGATDIMDPETNLRLGMAFLESLYQVYYNDVKVLMFYNMGYNGIDLYNSGVTSYYASEVLSRSTNY